MDEFSLEDRFPLINDGGRKMMQFLSEHPNAPPFNDQCADLLDMSGLQRVQAFAGQVASGPGGWTAAQRPPWLAGFLKACFESVPYYRDYDLSPAMNFTDIPTISRVDLERGAWHFVPDDLDLKDIVIYRTSGTTGHPIETIWHPIMCAMYLPLVQIALGWRGTAMGMGPDRVAQVMVCYQKHTVTCPCISAYLEQAGFVKVNLHPDAWHDPEDPAAYLDACNPDTYSGDPISFAALMKLPLKARPRALVSTAMALTSGFHKTLETHFQAPVVDLYSMTETGPIAAGVPGYQRVLPHHIYVEILDDYGAPLPPGERGEVTLTGGFNPYLPLVRYRTGDWAALSFEGRQPVLLGLEGRPPVLFVNTTGTLVNNIDVTHVLRPFGLVQYTLHQHQDKNLSLAYLGLDADPDELITALRTLFGDSQRINVQPLSVPSSGGGKVVQYTSELDLFDELSKRP